MESVDIIVRWAEADELIDGALRGGTVWLGFVATTLAVSTYFQGTDAQPLAGHNGYRLIAFVIMGDVLAVWD